MNSSLDRAIAFYLDSAVIKQEIGFTYFDVLQFEDEQLEKCHGYVQWLFPIKEPSAFIDDAPLFTEVTRAQYEEYYAIVYPRFVQAMARMMEFYFAPGRVKEWVTPRNHNFLRITRIIKSMKLFGQHQAENSFWTLLLVPLMNDPVYKDIIGPITAQFWKDAHAG
jgi:hypothetical protein